MEPEYPAPSLADAFVADSCHLRIPSEPARITPTVDFLVRKALEIGVVPPSRASRLMMALHEALTNSVFHGNLGLSSALKERGDEEFMRAVADRMADPAYATRPVEVHATYRDGTATWVFVDQGEGFDTAAALSRLDTEDHDSLRPSGRGLVMIRAFTDEMRYEDCGRRLILRLRKAGENRGHSRLPLGVLVHVAPIDAAGQVDHAAGRQAVARNLSSTGIAFAAADLVPSGQVIITIPTLGGPIQVTASVRHWHDLGDRVVEVGCRFETPLPAGADTLATSEAMAALDRLVAQMAAQPRPGIEQRRAPRVPYSERLSVEAAGRPAVSGFARDLSRLGVGFFTATSVPLEVVSLTLPAESSESAIRLPARIVRCTRLGDAFYDVAAHFLG